MNLEERIVAWAQQNGLLPELCEFVDYNPDIGRVPEHWVPRGDVLALVRALAAPPAPQAASGALTMAEGIGKYGVVKQWPDVAGLSGDAEREAFESQFQHLKQYPEVTPEVRNWMWFAWQARAAPHSTAKLTPAALARVAGVKILPILQALERAGWNVTANQELSPDQIGSALAAPADAPVAEPVALTEKQRRVLKHYNFAQFDADNLAKVPEAVRRDLWAMLDEMSALSQGGGA